MSVLDIFKTKYSRGFCFVAAGCYAIEDDLEGDVRQRKFRCPEHETAKEAELDTARHLLQRVERDDGIKAAQKTG